MALAGLRAFLPPSVRAVVPADFLAGLLAAGRDDDGWDRYHATVVQLVRELVEGEGEETLLPALLAALESALDQPEWPAKRLALAAVAACAATMPDALNLAMELPALEALLVAGTEDAGSHNSRRFAITALSHLRLLTPAVLNALLGALGSSPAAAELPGLRQRFAHLLSEGWSQPQAREPVWGDREAGSRGQAILAALLQVWGSQAAMARALASGIPN